MMVEQLGLPTIGPSEVIPHTGAYADMPGTGPAGETCKSCRHRVRHVASRTYNKCGLINWTHGAATDIRVNTPACRRWEAV